MRTKDAQTSQGRNYFVKFHASIGWWELRGTADSVTALLLEGQRHQPPRPRDAIHDPSPLATAREEVEQFLAGERLRFSFAFEMRGTPFQKQVWTELLFIPYGETVSYAEIASRIGRPKATRAVGVANSRNPLLLVIPCHRVIAASGKMNGWSGGPHHKEFLIQLEGRSRNGPLAVPPPSRAEND